MRTYEAIAARRSVRRYESRPVPDSVIDRILAAACAAPVGMGAYDSVCLTVLEGDALESLRSRLARIFPASDVLYGAPLMIIVSARFAEKGSRLENVHFENAACLIENMLLAATEEGLGSCYQRGSVGALRGDAEVRRLLQIPEGFELVSGAVFGYPAEVRPERKLAVTLAVTRP